MNLLVPPVFADDTIRMLVGDARGVVVDPGDAAPAGRAHNTHELRPASILVTRASGPPQGESRGFGMAAAAPALPAQRPRRGRINSFQRCAKPTVAADALAYGAACDARLAVFEGPHPWSQPFR
jgi:hypothetical protein